MPITQDGLPFTGRTPRSRQNSYLAAVRAGNDRASKSARYLAWLTSTKGASDHAAALHFAWPLSSVNSIRNGLMSRGLIHAIGDCDGPFDRRVTVWAVTGKTT